MISKKRITACLATIEAIAASDCVTEYLIGFTRQSAAQKGDAYRRLDFEHYIILADKMNRHDALTLERELQRLTMGNKGSAGYKKYHSEKKANGKLFSSAGGSPSDPLLKENSVYMVWF